MTDKPLATGGRTKPCELRFYYDEGWVTFFSPRNHSCFSGPLSLPALIMELILATVIAEPLLGFRTAYLGSAGPRSVYALSETLVSVARPFVFASKRACPLDVGSNVRRTRDSVSGGIVNRVLGFLLW